MTPDSASNVSMTNTRQVTPVPQGTKVVSFTFSWMSSDRTDPKNQQDVVMLCDDGHLYHYFYVPGSGWSGPEILDQLK